MRSVRSVRHTNRRGQVFHLHQGTTKTGKPKYFFSMKTEGILARRIPDGFEVYENPNAQVFLRKIQPRIITDEEVAVVEKGMKELSRLRYYEVDVKKNKIIVFEPDQDVDALREVLNSFPKAKEVGTEDLLAQLITYSPILQYVLVDEGKRAFVTERYCFLGSIDDWMEIGKPDKLKNLVKKYVKHLGRDSYYELF